ncbi:endonuclease V [Streptomyces zingiberis]|uniref:endonuclease V n=1 Tax=Streptomyces zingiberis TaxID=2053010 RepID=UPI0028929827|nr:endonuclease V [Streptomyces zingiberis]
MRPWPATEAEAVAEQLRLRSLTDTAGPGPAPGEVRTVAGVDVAYDEASGRLAAAAVVLDAETLQVVEEATATGRAEFPYVPGLLAFRELPSVLAALSRLSEPPGLVACDGYGIAHPRRLGLAAHLGVVTGLPAFGVAKTPFGFAFDAPGQGRGAVSPLFDGGETVGRALRTQDGVKPVFVSVGHRIGLDHAVAHTLRLASRHRLPETTRRADSLCRRALAALLAADARN